MLCIRHPETDPYFNLAAEEYVLKNFTDDCFMLGRNDASIRVGKHQNTLAEINIDYVKDKKIKVVRRLSGGGAVFHDPGNLNFTFIMNGEDGNLVDFRKFTEPVLEVLRKLNVDAKFEGRNDLTIEGKKFSGNAEHVWRKRVLHHGTLLFSSVITDLSQALKVNPLKFKDKAVQSIRSRVTNISDHLSRKTDIFHFSNLIMEHIMERYPESQPYEYSESDIAEISRLRDEKYSTWEWNFGYSPEYKFEKLIRTKGGNLEFHLNVGKGIIQGIKIFGDFFHRYDIDVIEKALTGIRHDPDEIRKSLSLYRLEDYFRDVTVEEFVGGMF